MTLAQHVDRLLPKVADSWAKLRKCDVYRLISQYLSTEWKGVGAVIIMNRPDLADEVSACIEDLTNPYE